MQLSTITQIRNELDKLLVGSRLGRVFPLSKFQFAIDFRLREPLFLFIAIEPSNPRIYMIRRRLRDLDKQSANPSPFILQLRKRLNAAALISVTQVENERALEFNFCGTDEFGAAQNSTLVIHLTGRSANAFLLDENRAIVGAAKERELSPGMIYHPPTGNNLASEQSSEVIPPAGTSLSEHLDFFYLEQEADLRFASLANSVRTRLKREKTRLERLVDKLNADLLGHGDADKWKRSGDLLLANIATLRREKGVAFVTDYFDENAATIEIPVDENDSVATAAEKYFKRYTKARNAVGEVQKRLLLAADDIAKLSAQQDTAEVAIAKHDEAVLTDMASNKQEAPKESPRGKKMVQHPGSRSFTSTDGFEILVGKKAKDNDYLTFRVAKSLDLWLHAADYPGSHVVIRNPNRKEIPPKTLLEAAELAAFYSDARTQPKAAVNYTPKKFVNKPRGGTPGLVSLSNFKTILVVPSVPENLSAN